MLVDLGDAARKCMIVCIHRIDGGGVGFSLIEICLHKISDVFYSGHCPMPLSS
jgi:hypothetical protein